MKKQENPPQKGTKSAILLLYLLFQHSARQRKHSAWCRNHLPRRRKGKLVDNNSILTFHPDEIILREGEDSKDMFKILKGNAEVYLAHGTENETLLGLLGKGACFGEFGLLLHEKSPYTVIAYSDIIIYRVTEDKIDEFIRENHVNILQMMKSMASTMMLMQSHINQLSTELDEKNKVNKRIVGKNKEMLKRYIYNR
ncbi:Cyclic nucleotide-binding domain-containing protein [Butyrivibrio sp. ob235]|nr:Cyclic nucleotide-binding domain-containing protein [Butyrivibrio sp. ob235]